MQYHKFKEKKLRGLWISSGAIYPLITKLDRFFFKKDRLGYSGKGNPVYGITTGNGKTKILLWSQMHGDEATATKVFFDFFNYISSCYHTSDVLQNILRHCQLLFIPMLNPDGADLFIRENGLNIDLNRDAKALKAPESKILHHIIENWRPDYAFNLHDQDSYYSVSGTGKPATLSFLAPAADAERSITESRKKAMRVIVAVNHFLQSKIPGQIGRYHDTYCDTCFGDRIQRTGVPTILIESGYFPGDALREETRALHFEALLEALRVISEQKFPDIYAYHRIPVNKRNYYDLRLNNVLYHSEIQDIGIRFVYKIKNGKLKKMPDKNDIITGAALANNFFHQTLDAGKKDFFKHSW